MTTERLALEPIGFVRSPFTELSATPRQPRVGAGVRGEIELFPGHGFEFAVEDLQPGQHLWVLFWFHRAQGWKPKVRPPRSKHKRGLFSTRSPHRPNPIGLSVVRLIEVRERTLVVEDLDILDGTPVLDLKPYLAYADAVPDAASGWLSAPDDPGPQWTVRYDALARAQLAYLKERGHDLEPGITSTLSLGPTPHPYRRIKREGDGFVLKHKAWRVSFRLDPSSVVAVTSIASGYRPKELLDGGADLDAHRDFTSRFAESSPTAAPAAKPE